jgi:hypothetical protein
MDMVDFIRIALEAGAKPSNNPEEWDILKIRDTDLERFFNLVAAHEREEYEKLCDYRVGIWLIPSGPSVRARAVIRRRGEK